MADDPRCATNEARVRNREALEPLFRTRTTEEWVRDLREADILCAPILSYPEIATQEHVAHRGMVVEVVHPQVGTARVAGIPIRLGETPGGIRRPAPLPGEHTVEILREAGYDEAAIGDLLKSGVVRAWNL
ncbi:MAG: CoA transferase [Armatimonadetes bacterium]|nr:CoA transferase [Armatimonadota bacterium]